MRLNILHLLKELQKHGEVDCIRNIAWRYQKCLRHCPVRNFKFYLSKRPLELRNNGPLYLSVIINSSSKTLYKKYQWKKYKQQFDEKKDRQLTLRCLLNGGGRLIIFRFFSDPPPVYWFSRNDGVQCFFSVAKWIFSFI